MITDKDIADQQSRSDGLNAAAKPQPDMAKTYRIKRGHQTVTLTEGTPEFKAFVASGKNINRLFQGE